MLLQGLQKAVKAAFKRFPLILEYRPWTSCATICFDVFFTTFSFVDFLLFHFWRVVLWLSYQYSLAVPWQNFMVISFNKYSKKAVYLDTEILPAGKKVSREVL